MRSIVFPVVGPVGGTWSELRQDLSESWMQATALANWLTTECYVRDVRRGPSDVALPQMPHLHLYPAARQRFPELPAKTVGALIRHYRAKYCSLRYRVLWTSTAALPTYRFSVPFPVPAQGWSSRRGERNSPLVEFRLGGRRWTLRLAGGRGFRRQLVAFDKLVRGQAARSELSVYRRRSNRSDHRTGTESRDRARQHIQFRVMCSLGMWLPKDELGEPRSGTLYVCTSERCFLTAREADGESVWTMNADHVRRWIGEHSRRLRRLKEDSYAVRDRAVEISAYRASAVARHRRRLSSFLHEASRSLARFVARRRYSEVCFEETTAPFCAEFPWARFRRVLREKLDEVGAELRTGNGASVS